MLRVTHRRFAIGLPNLLEDRGETQIMLAKRAQTRFYLGSPILGHSGTACNQRLMKTIPMRLVVRSLIAFACALPHLSSGAVLAAYTFGPDGSTPSVFTATTVAPSVTATAITAEAGAVLDGANPAVLPTSAPYLRVTSVVGNATPAAAVASNAAFTFTVSGDGGATLNLTSLTLDTMRGGASTPRGYDIRSSVDGYAVTLGSADIPTARPTFTNVSIPLDGASFQNLSSITFKVFHYSPGTGSSVDYDNVVVNGTVVPEPSVLACLLGGLACLIGARRRPRPGNAEAVGW
jgi:hypothetical protein